MDASTFLPFWARQLRSARATMFCLPHAGGGASTYRTWVGSHPDIDIQPLQLPGREDLTVMPLVDRADVIADMLARVVADVARTPVVMFGHSMGAALAAEITARLDREGCRLPELLVVSSRRGTHDESTADLADAGSTDEELVRLLLDLGGTASEVLDDVELCSLLLPIVRNDLRLMARYRPSFRRLPVPILAIRGDQDTVTEGELAAWRKRTDRDCTTLSLAGGHFYLRDQWPSVLKAISAALDHVTFR